MAERRAFLTNPLSENKPSTGTEDACGANKLVGPTRTLTFGYMSLSRCFFQNVNGDCFSASVSRIGEIYVVISRRMAFSSLSTSPVEDCGSVSCMAFSIFSFLPGGSQLPESTYCTRPIDSQILLPDSVTAALIIGLPFVRTFLTEPFFCSLQLARLVAFSLLTARFRSRCQVYSSLCQAEFQRENLWGSQFAAACFYRRDVLLPPITNSVKALKGIFTGRRQPAMQSPVLATVGMSVCLFVCHTLALSQNDAS